MMGVRPHVRGLPALVAAVLLAGCVGPGSASLTPIGVPSGAGDSGLLPG